LIVIDRQIDKQIKKNLISLFIKQVLDGYYIADSSRHALHDTPLCHAERGSVTK
jgi:hypothetical protein